MTSAEPAQRSGERARPRSWWRGGSNWLWGALLALDLIFLLLALSLANVTAEAPATRSLRHSVAILTEVDAFVDDHFEALQQQAATEEGPFTLPDFPVEVAFAPAELRAVDREVVRALLLDRSAERLYNEGMAAFQEDRRESIERFSAPGAVRAAMSLFSSTQHRIMIGILTVLAIVAAGLTWRLTLASRGYGRLLALGASITLGAAPVLILAIALRFTLRLASDGLDDYLAREFVELGQELSWAPIRNGIIFSVGGAVTLLSGIGLARWSDSRPHVEATRR